MLSHNKVVSRLAIIGAMLAPAGILAQTATIPTVTTTATAPVLLSPTWNVTLPLPASAATATCAPVTDIATTTQLLTQTFYDPFDTFDLSTNKWTPYYDGGYDETLKTWLGYDWMVKRTLTSQHEQQLYVDPLYKGTAGRSLGLNPFAVTNGILHIVGQRIPTDLRQYLYNYEFSSGVLTTRRSHLQRYGYFEVKAKVPAGAGLVPAFWMVPFDKSWPPELDIMEAPGSEPDRVVTTSHWKDASGAFKASGCRVAVPGFAQTFHTYGALWTADRIVYYIDRKPVTQMLTPLGMNLPMYMILNLALGGDWPGRTNSTTPIPVDFQIDWVVAYTTGSPATCGLLPNGVRQCPLQ
ncbi:family 16 glycosylhydrolase [Duganella sp. CT11-25]|uniref:glycoside hydrolase family 16 protein n=1 Tax=unclassified Duganella TaxID=2636909 RepID=UPI0039AEAEF7